MLRESARYILLTGVCMLAVTALACASTPSAAKDGTGKRAEKDDDIICKYVEPTGSHIPQLVCWERYQLDDRRQNDQDRVRDIQLGSSVKPVDGQQRQQPTSN